MATRRQLRTLGPIEPHPSPRVEHSRRLPEVLAAALAQADRGLAMGTGSDVAIEASDLTLVRGDLRVAGDAKRLSRRTLGTIKGNLFWALAYNIAALPLAAAGLLNPMLAGAAMAFSSVFVVSKSLRLRGLPVTDYRDVTAVVRATATTSVGAGR